jgi:hypothetical protein
MMLAPGAIAAVRKILGPEGQAFYRESHARIYRAALALHDRGDPVDAITLVDELDKRGELEQAGGKVRVHELACLMPTTANAAHYARQVFEAELQRKAIAAGDAIAQLGWERPRDVAELRHGARVLAAELDRALAAPAALTALGRQIEVGPLLDELVAFVRRYVVLAPAQADAIALWIAHTHALDAAHATPYLAITSAEKESGKTRLLETLEVLVARPWLTGRVTAAVLIRKVDEQTPTLLLDESDAAFAGEKEYAEALRGVLNTGYRRGGTASFCEKKGGDWTYRDASTFTPKAIAGIGHLPDTVASRSIPIRLKRKAPGEPAEDFFRLDVDDQAAPLVERLRQFAVGRLDELAAARPERPAGLRDRAADVWQPLFAIADLAGCDWPARARWAALELSSAAAMDVDDGSIGVRLLADVRRVFDQRGVDRLATAELLEGLAADEEAPWATWHRGDRISPRKLAGLLRRFDVRSKTIRLPDGETPKGFLREQFEDPWARYLAHPPSPSATTPQPASEAALSLFPIRHTTPSVADRRGGANPHGSCDVADVADRKRGERPPAGEAAFLVEVEEAIDAGFLVPLDDVGLLREARFLAEVEEAIAAGFCMWSDDVAELPACVDEDAP